MAKAQVFEAFTLEDLQEKINKHIKDKKVISTSVCELGSGNDGVIAAIVITE